MVVGAYSNTFPYSFQAKPGGKAEGFAVDLLDALARVMNFKIRRVVLPGEEIKARFIAGDFDMLQLLSVGKGREAWADYSITVLNTQNIMMVRLQGARTPNKLQDLRGARFAVAGTGSVGDLFLRAWDPAAKITYTESPEQALRLLGSGEVDATLLSRLTAVSLIEKLGLRNVAELRDPAAYLEHHHAFAVHKGDTALLARLNEGLAILQRSGEYDQLHRKWLGRYEPAQFTREEVFSYTAVALAVALLIAVWAGLRQLALRRRIARQASDLAEQAELLSALYENVPLGMWVFDRTPQGSRVRSINRKASEFFGLASADVVGRMLSELRLVPEWADLLKTVLDGSVKRKGLVIEPRILPGSQRHLMVTHVPLAPRPGGMQRLCVLVEDVTERWRLDEEIEQGRRLRAIGELVGGIAHEFNNLMTPVMLKVGDVSSTHPDDEELQGDLAVVSQAVQRAANLTARLLTFGRKGERKTESLPLVTVTEKVIHLLRPTIDERIALENAVAHDLPPLVFNATDLDQILINLLLNARDTLIEKLAVRESATWRPCIRISAAQLRPDSVEWPLADPDRVLTGWRRITVQDNGLGISPAVRERIFEPFYTTKCVGQGTGLGLATVWHQVTAAGGRIDLETTLGEGSVFNVLLPVWARPTEPRA